MQNRPFFFASSVPVGQALPCRESLAASLFKANGDEAIQSRRDLAELFMKLFRNPQRE
jgi:hypothetical protein